MKSFFLRQPQELIIMPKSATYNSNFTCTVLGATIKRIGRSVNFAGQDGARKYYVWKINKMCCSAVKISIIDKKRVSQLETIFHVHMKWQESCAIAKMTAQCALYMGALKIFGTPLLGPRLLFPNIFHGLLFGSTLWMFLQNLKSVELHMSSWDRGGS